ncbi:MAG TPA: TIGR03960 family B12-binding radical SAM protein [bacterium]|nr:TIGR03960 family B12-binding radical SAM protein [bacterium]HQB09041.1 TIGR03960 family B12-binding radical SAM protein [bacterium]HQM84992.1 TIGR03960 family B12-binding radical SAM protein [bacterium]
MITSVLRNINKPGRYFAPFIEPVRIESDPSKPKVLILFPDIFEMAQSHTGVKILYSIFHRSGFNVDFGFAPDKDFIEIAKKEGTLRSMMHDIDFRHFDLICVSFQYQLQYPAFLKILELAGIPVTSKERSGSNMPVIIAGGPVMCNPEPVSDFLDAAFIGEFEPASGEVLKVLLQVKGREKIIEEFSKIEGFYIPDGSLSGTVVRRSVLSDLNYDPDSLFDAPVFAMRTIHDRFTIEIMRGCTRGCRFCMAGSFYRPHREKSAKNICGILDRVVKTSGYDEAGFLSLSVADHSEIEEILVESYGKYSRGISISLPSLRTETLTSKIVSAIRKGRKSGFTLAPESGSERLRKIINKDNTNEEIIEAVRKIFSNGWQNVKLYFMLGLPLENDEDIVETVDLVKKICSLARGFGKKAGVTASFSTFIPQPFTPFQWEKMATPEEIKAKQHIILDGLRNIKNLKLSWHSQEISTVEGYLSRAGREFNNVIRYVAERMEGLQTDDENFNSKLWNDALLKNGIDPYTTMIEKPVDKPLPYEHIDMRIDRSFLLREREKGYNSERTADCADGNCENCGACDFDNIKPRIKTGSLEHVKEQGKQEEVTNRGNSYPYIFTISKKGRAISVGHLDLVSFLFKVFSMCGLKILYSDGFHPMPRFNLAFPAPVGVEVEEEFGTVWLTDVVDEVETIGKLNALLDKSGITFGMFKLIDREQIKKVEKVLRTVPVQSYFVKFKDVSDMGEMAEALDSVEKNEQDLSIVFDHVTEKGGVLKLFENVRNDFHVIKKSYRDKLLIHDTEGVLKNLI